MRGDIFGQLILPRGCVYFSGVLYVAVLRQVVVFVRRFSVLFVCTCWDSASGVGGYRLVGQNSYYDVRCTVNLGLFGPFPLGYRDMHLFLHVGPPLSTLFMGVNCISVFLLF